jgi:hypothetical protein
MSDREITPEERDMAESFGLNPQPSPVHNDRPSSHDRVIAMFVGRREFGLAKYGTALQAGNGRDHIVDVLEEMADAMVYLQTAKDEHALALRKAWAEGYGKGCRDMEAARKSVDDTGVWLEPSRENPYPNPYRSEY